MKRNTKILLTSIFLLFLLIFPGLVFPQSETNDETDYEGEISEKDSRLVKAMKIGMYDFVSDDEEIDIVSKWIADGAKKDKLFDDEVIEIMKLNCTKCHSASSTMSKAVPDLPLTTYEEINVFTKSAPTDTQCLECHADPNLEGHSVTGIENLFVHHTEKAMSVHGELTCVHCHLDFHTEADQGCQDVTKFKSSLTSDQTAADFGCQELKKVGCSTCHQKEADLFQKSTHFTIAADSQEKAPVCKDCHGSHDVISTKINETKFAIVDNCRPCHPQQTDSYFKTYHGKTAILGSEKSAKCFNCHGSHELLAATDPSSTIHPDKIQKTCSQCHDNVTANFVGFIPHADPVSTKKYPQLFYTFWAMTGLLIGTFSLFGIHTLLWLYRSSIERFQSNTNTVKSIDRNSASEKHVRRFKLSHTVLHFMIIVSFLSLALTGMTLKFPANPFFAAVVEFFGGPHIMGLIHRIGAVITFAYAAIHLFQLGALFKKRKITVKGLLKEEYSLIPLSRDFKELKANLLYFIGKAPKPAFGKWTYWEKFDYMAVFWGITIIGLTGLMLWFPQTATQYLPGWVLNVATIIHSDEALLAAGFIFTFHFFHNHMRPESFPMDPVIFTQKMPLTKFKEERPREYQDLVDKDELTDYLVDPPTKWYAKTVLVLGMTFLAFGLIIIGAILYSLLLAI